MTACEKLAANQVFAGISPDALAPIRDAGKVMSANAGDRLIEEGEANPYLYLVLDGEVEVCLPKTSDRFSAIRLGTRGAGTCIGEYGFIDKKSASAAVTATMSTELFRISHRAFEKLLSTDPALGGAVYRNLLLQLIDRLRAIDADLDLFRPL